MSPDRLIDRSGFVDSTVVRRVLLLSTFLAVIYLSTIAGLSRRRWSQSRLAIAPEVRAR
jgi:hypothetical protein